MKKLTAIVAVFLCINVTSVHAETPKSLVIIDTGYDFNYPHDNIVYEKCISNSNYPSCPNGSTSQEGSGSAVLNNSQLSLPNANHGTEMLAASKYIGNVPIIFIRLSSFTKNNMYLGSDIDLRSALDWVYANQTKYNVGAISFSMGRQINNCNLDVQMATSIKNLVLSGIPFIAAAGNMGLNQVDYPSCLKPAISIGGVDQYGLHALWSNSGIGLDFDAQGVLDVMINNKKVHQVGSSVSTVIFATDWIFIKQSKPNLTYDQEYNLIKNTSTLVSNVKIKNIPSINLNKVLQNV
jgi:hypothetical protein